jgi:hypothetical protein
MAGISLSVEGDKIQLSFQKDDQSTAILMDAGAARTLASALTQLLDVLDDELAEELAQEIEEGEGEELTEELVRQLAEGDGADSMEGELVDITSPTIDIGLDEEGQPVIGLQAGDLPPFLLRLRDEEARHIAESLAEILNAPRDARLSQGGH